MAYSVKCSKMCTVCTSWRLVCIVSAAAAQKKLQRGKWRCCEMHSHLLFCFLPWIRPPPPKHWHLQKMTLLQSIFYLAFIYWYSLFFGPSCKMISKKKMRENWWNRTSTKSVQGVREVLLSQLPKCTSVVQGYDVVVQGGVGARVKAKQEKAADGCDFASAHGKAPPPPHYRHCLSLFSTTCFQMALYIHLFIANSLHIFIMISYIVSISDPLFWFKQLRTSTQLQKNLRFEMLIG